MLAGGIAALAAIGFFIWNSFFSAPETEQNFSNVIFEKSSNFDIGYYPDVNQFVVLLQNQNLDQAREEAEKAFLDSLQISKRQACQLNVYLGVSLETNFGLSGRDFGLSFCPDGIIIEE